MTDRVHPAVPGIGAPLSDAHLSPADRVILTRLRRVMEMQQKKVARYPEWERQAKEELDVLRLGLERIECEGLAGASRILELFETRSYVESLSHSEKMARLRLWLGLDGGRDPDFDRYPMPADLSSRGDPRNLARTYPSLSIAELDAPTKASSS